jgi:hypothetical protein
MRGACVSIFDVRVIQWTNCDEYRRNYWLLRGAQRRSNPIHENEIAAFLSDACNVMI